MQFDNLLNSYTNQLKYSINNALLRINTILPCKIVAIDQNSNSATVETIILPYATNQTSPAPAQITNVPICQIKGGSSGIIIQYNVGDIVLCGAIQRDITVFKKAWRVITAQKPSSLRKFDLSDVVIICSLDNAQATQNYIKVTDTGITIQATSDITINTTNNAVINARKVLIGGATGLATEAVLTGAPQTGQTASTKTFTR